MVGVPCEGAVTQDELLRTGGETAGVDSHAGLRSIDFGAEVNELFMDGMDGELQDGLITGGFSVGIT